MRTHTKTFHIRFTEKEYERLCKYAEKSGLPKTTYIRHMINGYAPKEHPPADYFKMMKEMHRVGNNLNQLVWTSHRFGNMHTKDIDAILEQFRKVIDFITDELIMPETINKNEILELGRLQAEKDKEDLEQWTWKIK